MSTQDTRTDLFAARRTTQWWRRVWALAGLCTVAGGLFVARWYVGPDFAAAQLPFFRSAKSAPAETPAPAAPADAAPASPSEGKLAIVAMVNAHKITREELAQECLWRYGSEVLESVLNKALVVEACRARGVSVSPEEVSAEIDRMAERFGVPREQWLKMLEQERGITAEQYASDIIWPTVALRKLADARLTVTEQDLEQAYETHFGPAVQVRLITTTDLAKAQRVRAAAIAKPDDFGNLAKDHSEDANSASARGLIQPIRRHMGDSRLEEVAFALQPGEISEIVAVGNQYVILKCESHIPGRRVPMAEVERVLRDAIRDKKLRLAGQEVFAELQQATPIVNYFDDPAQRAQHPDVAATVSGQPYTTAALAEACIERHGVEVLDGLINRRILEQTLAAAGLTIADAELQAEVARAAIAMGKVKPGTQEPDLEAWIATVQEEQGITYELYLHDAVWPSVALKKLVEGRVTVDEADLNKGFEANYGPRVRCRAIVLNNMRRAQEVWDLARRNPTVENFGKLAEQYSIEPGSSTMQGEVPPIQKHSGQPNLEAEAFALAVGEISGIVQVEDKFVILFCEGHTTPTAVDFAEVRDLIYEDVLEKKTRVAMAQEFARLRDNAQIDNFLTGRTQSGVRGAGQLLDPAAAPGAAAPAAGAPGS